MYTKDKKYMMQKFSANCITPFAESLTLASFGVIVVAVFIGEGGSNEWFVCTFSLLLGFQIWYGSHST